MWRSGWWNVLFAAGSPKRGAVRLLIFLILICLGGALRALAGINDRNFIAVLKWS